MFSAFSGTLSFETVYVLWTVTYSLSIDHKAGARNFSGERQNGVENCELLVNTHTSIFSLTSSLVLHTLCRLKKKKSDITIWNFEEWIQMNSLEFTPTNSRTLCVCSCRTLWPLLHRTYMLTIHQNRCKWSTASLKASTSSALKASVSLSHLKALVWCMSCLWYSYIYNFKDTVKSI